MLELHKDHVIETPNYTEEMGLISEMQKGGGGVPLTVPSLPRHGSVAWCSRTRATAPDHASPKRTGGTGRSS